jgi:hypothetical protein
VQVKLQKNNDSKQRQRDNNNENGNRYQKQEAGNRKQNAGTGSEVATERYTANRIRDFTHDKCSIIPSRVGPPFYLRFLALSEKQRYEQGIQI